MNTQKTSQTREGNIVVGLLIGAVIALIPSYYFYTKYQEANKKLKNPQAAAQEEIKGVTDKLGVLMELPKNETPTIATVTDKGKLKDQPFFKSAQNGDKVLLYINARKAILYREKDNKIIEVAPININQNATGAAAVDQNATQQGTTPQGVTPTGAAAEPSGAMEK